MRFLICLLILMSTSYAQTGARILLIKGDATFKGQKLEKDSVVNGKGEFILGDKSYLKLLLEKSKTIIALGANTTSSIDLEQKGIEPDLNLIKGTARWLTGTKKLRGGGIKTSNASMGIRGTDFFVSFNPVFGETEVICFEGNIQFTNGKNKADSKLIGKNQWGGIGGRFGKKLSDILNVPETVISTFKKGLPLE